MKIHLEVESVDVDVNGILRKINNDDAFWTFAASTWHKLYSPYVPFAEGNLEQTVDIQPKEITHKVPYARYQYYGTRFRFRRDMHPKASAKWDKAAAPTQLPRLITSLQAYIDSGKLKI